ncbi:MAG TPA: GNAT family N-acetyltransferase [Actinomycetota bacterium]|nr:GNAT family N-acetyltransferase [Actinomycetota bacterium]
MAFEIRQARPEEYAEAGRITADAYREFFDEDDPDLSYLDRIGDVGARAERTTVLVAAEDGRILGSLTLELDGRVEGHESETPLAPDQAHIRMLGVARDERSRGVGGALLRDAEQRARAAGRTHVTLNTTLRMEAARRMYDRTGYVRGEDRVFPDGFVLLTYRKELAGGSI